MPCSCGCGARCHGVSMRRALATPGRSRTSIGQSASMTFNASDYVPADIQSDITTGRAYYNAFSQASGAVHVGPGGSLSLSPAAQEAVAGAIEATATGAIAVALPGAGAVFALALALAPKAGAGPGVCTTDPPASAYLGDLQAWPHFTSWQSMWGAYPAASAGTFEAYANPVLESNWVLGANCFGDKMVPAPILLVIRSFLSWAWRRAQTYVRRRVSGKYWLATMAILPRLSRNRHDWAVFPQFQPA